MNRPVGRSAARALGPAHAIILAVVLAGCLWG